MLATAFLTPFFSHGEEAPPLPPERPAARVASRPPDAPLVHGSDPACLARLEPLGLEIEWEAKIPPPARPECAIVGPVAVKAVRGLPGNPAVWLAGRPVLACAMAERLAQFLLDVADPSARQALGAGIAQIDAGPGYVCRTRNNQAGAKTSSHAQGLAVDLAGIVLEGGKAFRAGAPSLREERDFIAHITQRACAHFNTVLGIGADAFHGDNIHIDLEPRGRNGDTKFCR